MKIQSLGFDLRFAKSRPRDHRERLSDRVNFTKNRNQVWLPLLNGLRVQPCLAEIATDLLPVFCFSPSLYSSDCFSLSIGDRLHCLKSTEMKFLTDKATDENHPLLLMGYFHST